MEELHNLDPLEKKTDGGQGRPSVAGFGMGITLSLWAPMAGDRPKAAKTLHSIKCGWPCGGKSKIWPLKRATVREKEEDRLHISPL